MLKESNKERLLSLFFQDPLHPFYLRELSRKARLAPVSVKQYLKEFMQASLVAKKGLFGHPTYAACHDSEEFRLLKKLHTIRKIIETGLLSHVQETLLPDAIVLFGSASKGEDTMDSDIDLFVQAQEISLHLSRYERLLHRKISVFFQKDFGKLSEELKNNLINGIVLKGYLTAYDHSRHSGQATRAGAAQDGRRNS